LGPLVNKVKDYQVETIVDALCTNMVSDKEQLRDISSIGLKTVISELPLGCSALVANVCRRITGKLSSAIEKVNYFCLTLIEITKFFSLITYLYIMYFSDCIKM